MINRDKPSSDTEPNLIKVIDNYNPKKNNTLKESKFESIKNNYLTSRIKLFLQDPSTFFETVEPCQLSNDSDGLSHIYSSILDLYKQKRPTLIKNIPSEKLCLSCGIEEPKTLDHYMPKGSFPSFALEYNNLYWMCRPCNETKWEKFRNDSNNLIFLNPYFHTVNFQYLTAKISFEPEFKVKFKVKPNGDSDLKLQHLINNHYEDLKLLERFESKSATESARLIRNFKDGNLSKTQIFNIVQGDIDFYSQNYGINHFLSVLYSELVKNIDQFHSYISRI